MKKQTRNTIKPVGGDFLTSSIGKGGYMVLFGEMVIFGEIGLIGYFGLFG